jgi:hypothetical protein
MPAAKERDMNDETEQRKRVMAWAHEKIKTDTLNGAIHEYMLLRPVQNYVPMHRVIRAVLLAQEAEIAEQRKLLERCVDMIDEEDIRDEIRAHLRGTKAGWSEVLGILNDGSTPRETLEEVTQKFIDDETERRAEADELEPLELNRRQCNASNSTVGGDPAGRLDLANAIFLNDMAHQIEQRDADIVAAIAEVRQEIERCKNRYDKLIPREFAETNRDRIAKLKENHQNKLDKMQEQIDSLWERTDIYVDLQEKQQEQIDALTEAVLAMDAEYGFSHPIVIKALNKLRATQGKQSPKGESDG